MDRQNFVKPRRKVWRDFGGLRKHRGEKRFGNSKKAEFEKTHKPTKHY